MASMTEKERVDRFEAAYNRIDRALGELLDRNGARRHTFAVKVRLAARRQRRLARYQDFLLEVADLRNAVVHNRTGEDVFIAVPSEQTVVELEEIERRMFSPPQVLPRFKRHVTTLTPDQSLSDVFALIRHDGYSRYPVYDRGTFVGLLTSNGLARWGAMHVVGGRLEADLREVRVSDVLGADHRKDHVAFMPRDGFVDDAVQLYRDNPRLEAVIITEHGRASEQPLGMMCAGDLAGLNGA